MKVFFTALFAALSTIFILATPVFAQTTPWNIQRDAADNNKLKFWYNNLSSSTLTLTTNQRVGINAVDPVAQLEIRGNCGASDCRQVYVTYPSGGQLTGTEFSALAYPSYDGINAWTAIYGKGGSMGAYAGYFNGKVTVKDGDFLVTTPGSNQGTYIGLFKDYGSLPGYPSYQFPVLKTDFSYLYFAAAGQYIGYSGPGTGYVTASSKTMKDDYKEINPDGVLAKIDQLPIMEWHFKGTEDSIRHIGPFAEDFHALFNLNGADNTMISPTDEMGITLVGVKALSQQIKTLQAQNSRLEQQIKELNERIARISSN